MKQDVLEVLIYIFENYIVDGISFESGQDELAEELIGAGFSGEEVDRAFIWLEDLIANCEQDETQRLSSQTSQSIRFFTIEEHKRLGLDGQSLLLRLFNTGVLDQYSREMVIDRVMALDFAELHLDHIRWVVLMVLSNRPGFHEISEWAEVVVGEKLMPVIH